MRVTEQIDALEALGTEPVQYLFVPRVTSSISCAAPRDPRRRARDYGGYLVAVKLLEANPIVTSRTTFQFLEL